MSGTSSPEEHFERLRTVAAEAGMDVVASARLDKDLKKTFHGALAEISGGLDSAIVIGVRLSGPVLDTVVRAPTWTYYHHYRMVNMALDQAGLRLAGECMRMGYRSFPVPASQILEWDRLQAHLSHRVIGASAGVGWRGRNNLLVHPEYGSQVRYATILTDMLLPGAEVSRESCRECVACLSVCPVGAIKKDPEEFDLDKCAAQLRRFSKEEKLNTLICGICVRACGERADRSRKGMG
jgi:epoxyqueuosine reductase QueG